MANVGYPNIRRVWQRNAAHERVGVDVLGPDCLVAVDYLDPREPTSGLHLHFSAAEWDEIVRAVTDKRHEIRRRLTQKSE